MLRKSIISKIYKSLEKSPFSSADFDVKTPEGSQVLLDIVFSPHPEFTYKVEYPFKGASNLERHLSPGKHQMHEGGSFSDIGKIHEEVLVWARLIRDELRATMPVYSEIEELKMFVEDNLREDIANSNEPFNNEEIDQLKSKFDELLGKFEELKEKSEITEQELKNLKREIGAVKENLKTFPKGVWYKTAASKVFGLFSKIATSSESRKVLASAAKKALELD